VHRPVLQMRGQRGEHGACHGKRDPDDVHPEPSDTRRNRGTGMPLSLGRG
jgi:hypothetical protein